MALKPMVDMLSDPDYVNQTMATWVDDSSLGFQEVLDAIRFAWLYAFTAGLKACLAGQRSPWKI